MTTPVDNTVPSYEGDDALAPCESMKGGFLLCWAPTEEESWAIAKVAYALDTPDGYALWHLLEFEEQGVCFKIRQQFDSFEPISISTEEQRIIGQLTAKLIAIRDGCS